MNTFQRTLLGGALALSLAACGTAGSANDPNTTSGSVSPGAQTATGMGGTNNGVVNDSTVGNGVTSAPSANSAATNATTSSTGR